MAGRRRRWQRESSTPLGMAYRELEFILKLFATMAPAWTHRQRRPTLRESASQAQQRLHLRGDALWQLAQLYYRLRWGNVVPSSAQITEARRLAEEIHAVMHNAPAIIPPGKAGMHSDTSSTIAGRKPAAGFVFRNLRKLPPSILHLPRY